MSGQWKDNAMVQIPHLSKFSALAEADGMVFSFSDIKNPYLVLSRPGPSFLLETICIF